jgi:hypothetical protein
LLFLCLAAALPARGRKEVKNIETQTTQTHQTEEKKLVEVLGKVRLVGHEPFPELVISGEDGEWYIDKDEEYLLRDMQQRMVIVEGEETVIELMFANGLSAGVRRTLSNIKIISVH